MPTPFVPSFEHDIFVSYATVDDKQVLDRPGRVSTFIELLCEGLGRMLGRSDEFSIWMDRASLTSAAKLTPGIEKPVRSSAIMLVFLSNGYLASPWCPLERQLFLDSLTTASGDRARLFIVELDKIEDDQKPKEFAEYLAHRFWVQGPLDKHPRRLGALDPAEADYRSLVDGLACELAEVLKKMKDEALGTPPPPAKPRTTVYLAETTDDLEPTWRKVKTYLERQEIIVVPKIFLPRQPEEFQQAVKENLIGVELFVQLLNLTAGRKVDEQQSYVGKQHDLARAANIPLLQWRDKRWSEQDIAEVEDANHRALLDGPDVQAVQIEEFKQEVLKTLARQRDARKKEQELLAKREAAADGKKGDQFIFVLADPKEGPLAQSIFDYLVDLGFYGALPITLTVADGSTTPAEIRADFEDNLRLADGAIVVYGQSTMWCRSQLTKVRQIQAQNSSVKPPCLMGVYEAPSPRPPLGYRLPRMQTLSSKEGFDELALQPFVEALRNTVAAGVAK